MSHSKSIHAGTATAGSSSSRRLVANNAELVAWVRDARQRTIELVADLTDEQLLGPQLTIINPLQWEIGHVA